VGRIRVVADQLQGEVSLDGGADVHVAVVVERPSSVLVLPGAEVAADLSFSFLVAWIIHFAEEVVQHHIIARDGGVGLELEYPVAVVALPCQQLTASVLNDVIELLDPEI
jgi:hypothetical protein